MEMMDFRKKQKISEDDVNFMCFRETWMYSYVDVIVGVAVEGDGVVQVDSNAAAVILELRVPRVSKLFSERVQHRVVEV